MLFAVTAACAFLYFTYIQHPLHIEVLAISRITSCELRIAFVLWFGSPQINDPWLIKGEGWSEARRKPWIGVRPFPFHIRSVACQGEVKVYAYSYESYCVFA